MQVFPTVIFVPVPTPAAGPDHGRSFHPPPYRFGKVSRVPKPPQPIPRHDPAELRRRLEAMRQRVRSAPVQARLTAVRERLSAAASTTMG
jgi:hypothetical protein